MSLAKPILSRTQYRDRIKISWNTIAGAVKYRILRGDLLLAETAEKEYMDYFANLRGQQTVQYTVYAMSDTETSPASVMSFTPTYHLVTDRTAADVSARNDKGTYNAGDLNRVADAAMFLAAKLEEYGYHTEALTVRDNWAVNNIPRASEMQAHLDAVRSLDVIRYAETLIRLPVTMERLTYGSANAVEEFLQSLAWAVERIPMSRIYSGEIYGGEL